ncbi:MAG: (E)-4-hydroxy-3-methylbut-2-enyl-diphosphate synthase [Bacteroidetes bacterium]|nr:(E)-4-hydroxy-3-methylbut-2-enyl-diphosphate synthase [Bacteroidota bacterium]
MGNHYCNSLTQYSRLLTREVNIGGLYLGAHHPIRVQSMTTTDTMDTAGTVAQSIRMIEAGCELVRITAPSMNEAQNLENIKNELRKKGYQTPLVADIHFTPNAAELAARLVEKVRINPGNYADKKKFEELNYTDAGYHEELERIRERFTPLVKICKEYGTAMRIGTNHGSLSDRIMSRYGDTPLGMVESALEFLQICEDENFYNIVISMKASNTQVMIQAYRLLIMHLRERNANDPIYPLHLGVTEAGDGEDGRIKSAVGIGTLLEDGIGDTIRVSLTEDPEFEIPVAKALAMRYTNRAAHQPIKELEKETLAVLPDLYSATSHNRRLSIAANNIGGRNVPRVIADLSTKEKISHASLFAVGYNYSVAMEKWNISDLACDFVFTGNSVLDFEIPGTLGVICNYETWNENKEKERTYPFVDLKYITDINWHRELNFISINADTFFELSTIEKVKSLVSKPGCVLVLHTKNEAAAASLRRVIFYLLKEHIQLPLVIKRNYNTENTDAFRLYSATDCGALLNDGFGDAVWLSAALSPVIINSTAFGILQAARTRISKTEYISCPSCGRTLFDLQETTARIRARTSHLKGVKIGIMGCIVNGPGEMADADYGYVGAGVGKIILYKGKEVVQRNIPETDAVDALIELIKANGDWKEEPVLEQV